MTNTGDSYLCGFVSSAESDLGNGAWILPEVWVQGSCCAPFSIVNTLSTTGASADITLSMVVGVVCVKD